MNNHTKEILMFNCALKEKETLPTFLVNLVQDSSTDRIARPIASHTPRWPHPQLNKDENKVHNSLYKVTNNRPSSQVPPATPRYKFTQSALHQAHTRALTHAWLCPT